jgi:hypothetical protein
VLHAPDVDRTAENKKKSPAQSHARLGPSETVAQLTVNDAGVVGLPVAFEMRRVVVILHAIHQDSAVFRPSSVFDARSSGMLSRPAQRAIRPPLAAPLHRHLQRLQPADLQSPDQARQHEVGANGCNSVAPTVPPMAPPMPTPSSSLLPSSVSLPQSFEKMLFAGVVGHRH